MVEQQISSNSCREKKKILSKYHENGKLFHRDTEKKVIAGSRFSIIKTNFASLKNFFKAPKMDFPIPKLTFAPPKSVFGCFKSLSPLQYLKMLDYVNFEETIFVSI